MQIEINDEFSKALKILLHTNDNLFVTGNAGTGKTTFLKYCISHTNKKTAILAPTGVAALNAGGETIHSFFKFKTDVTLSKISKKKLSLQSIYKNIDTIIIDEASMLRCDLLDCIDKFLRLNGKHSKLAFGGVQMVFIGDLHQLPPVVNHDEQYLFQGYYDTPYFFSAKSMKESFCHIIELKKIYRQTDDKFIELLNAIRNNDICEDKMALLNSRVGQTFKKGKFSIMLTGTNKAAEIYNDKFLNELDSFEQIFTAETEDIENIRSFPVNYELKLKPGAQVMMLNNDPKNRWVNGSIGVVEKITKAIADDKDIIHVRFNAGNTEVVEQYKWEIFKHKWNEELSQIETERVGCFSQYPLKLAWAVTIHKSQGKTFDNVMIDLGYSGAFAPGQLYVALSRCRGIDGISLARPVKQKDIIVDQRIKKLFEMRERINYLSDPEYSLV